MKSVKLIVSALAVFLVMGQIAHAAPIKRISGLIVEIEEDYLWVIPEGKNVPIRFVLKWKTHFSPARLPLKGDHVMVLYKNKDEGRVIYGLNFLKTTAEALSSN